MHLVQRSSSPPPSHQTRQPTPVSEDETQTRIINIALNAYDKGLLNKNYTDGKKKTVTSREEIPGLIRSGLTLQKVNGIFHLTRGLSEEAPKRTFSQAIDKFDKLNNDSAPTALLEVIYELLMKFSFKNLSPNEKTCVIDRLSIILTYFGHSANGILASLESDEVTKEQLSVSFNQIFKILLYMQLEMAQWNEWASRLVLDKKERMKSIGLEAQHVLAAMQPGNGNDPIKLYCKIVGFILENNHPIGIENLPWMAKQFVILPMIKAGTKLYESDPSFANILNVYFNRRISDMIKKKQSNQHYCADIVEIAKEFVEFIVHCSKIPNNLAAIGLILCRFNGGKDTVDKIDFAKIVGEMQEGAYRTQFVTELILCMLTYNKFSNVVKFLDLPNFSELKKDDFICMLYLMATYMRKYRTEEKHVFSADVLLKIDEIDQRIGPPQNPDDDNYSKKKFFITQLHIFSKNQVKAQKSLEDLISFFAYATTERPDAIEMFMLIDMFGHHFVNSDSNFENADAIHHMERFYMRLAQAVPQMNIYIDGRLLKLYVFLTYDAGKSEYSGKKDEYLARKAAYDEKYQAFLTYVEEHPEDDESEKIAKLHELTQLTTANETAELIAEQSNRDAQKVIKEQQKLSLEKEQAKIRAVGVVEANPTYILMNDGSRIPFELCKAFIDGRACYVYCDERVLEEAGQHREAFEHQIYTEPGFVKNPIGQNGFKRLQDGVFEVKINDDPRILGFETQATMYVDGKPSETISLLYFNKYVGHAHTADGETAAFENAVKAQIAAKKLNTNKL